MCHLCGLAHAKPLDKTAIDAHNTRVSRKDPMQTVTISPNIRYVSLSDEDGDFGLFLHMFNGQLLNAHEVHSRDEFVNVLNTLRELTQPVEEVA